MGSVPTNTTLHEEAKSPYQRTDNDHRVQANEAPLEEVPHRESFIPATVIGITDDKA